MSATTALVHEPRYEDQLKLARAETVVAWATAALDHAIGALRIEPTAFVRDASAARRQHWYGSIY